jgi:hypothetical protein
MENAVSGVWKTLRPLLGRERKIKGITVAYKMCDDDPMSAERIQIATRVRNSGLYGSFSTPRLTADDLAEEIINRSKRWIVIAFRGDTLEPLSFIMEEVWEGSWGEIQGRLAKFAAGYEEGL